MLCHVPNCPPESDRRAHVDSAVRFKPCLCICYMVRLLMPCDVPNVPRWSDRRAHVDSAVQFKPCLCICYMVRLLMPCDVPNAPRWSDRRAHVDGDVRVRRRLPLAALLVLGRRARAVRTARRPRSWILRLLRYLQPHHAR